MQRRVVIIFFFCLAAIVGLYFYIQITAEQNKKFRVIFLNVGQGDASLIRFSDGKKMLVDCGIDRQVLDRLGKYLPFYDRTLDYLVVTHPDADHYGGCAEVLKRYDIKNIITNGEAKASDPYWSVWKKYVAGESAQEKIIERTENLDMAGAKIKFFAPDKSLNLIGQDTEGNNNSIVFRLENQRDSFLFVGDAEIPLENALLTKYCLSTTTPVNCPELKVDYLKVGHHGSDSSSGELFLDAVSPKQAIISVGKNTFGHPSFRVLRKLERAGAAVWRTDEKNDIIIE